MTVEDDRLPDEARVVRCGKPPFEPVRPRESCVPHAGHFGFSVRSGDGISFEELARWCPNRKVGVTSVGAIRALGYDAVVTPGRGHHATVVVDPGWAVDGADRLGRSFVEATNPSPRTAR